MFNGLHFIIKLKLKKTTHCRTVPKYNRKTVEASKIDNHYTYHIYVTAPISWLDTDTLIKSGRIKLVYGPKPTLLVKRILYLSLDSCEDFSDVFLVTSFLLGFPFIDIQKSMLSWPSYTLKVRWIWGGNRHFIFKLKHYGRKVGWPSDFL